MSVERFKIIPYDIDGNKLPEFIFPDDLCGWTTGHVSVNTWDKYYTKEDAEKRKGVKEGDWMQSNFISEGMTFDIVQL